MAFTLLLTIGFVSVALHYPRGRAHALDVVVVSLLYGAWFAMGVPKLLSYLSPAFVSQAIDVTVKVEARSCCTSIPFSLPLLFLLRLSLS